MPIYEYNCNACGKQFEKIVPVDTADGDIACPDCGEHESKKKFSTFAKKIGFSMRAKSSLKPLSQYMEEQSKSGGPCGSCPGSCGY